MGGKRFLPKWPARARAPDATETASTPTPTAGGSTAAPLPRAPVTAHHWLTVLVARPGPHAPVPAPGARVTVRVIPKGDLRPADVVARGTTRDDGTVELHLPVGRYAIAARLGDDARVVTVTLQHAGRALVLLDRVGRRVALTVEATRVDGRTLVGVTVDARAVPGGGVAARGTTDERGVVQLDVPPGAYEVRVGTTVVKTYAEADTLLRLSADVEGPLDAEKSGDPKAMTRYQAKVRSATQYVAAYELGAVREDIYN